MENVTIFDTYEVVKRLTEAGFTELQAEAIAKEQKSIIEGNLATKKDVEELRKEIELLRQDNKKDILELKVLMYKTTIATILSVAALLKFLPNISF